MFSFWWLIGLCDLEIGITIHIIIKDISAQFMGILTWPFQTTRISFWLSAVFSSLVDLRPCHLSGTLDPDPPVVAACYHHHCPEYPPYPSPCPPHDCKAGDKSDEIQSMFTFELQSSNEKLQYAQWTVTVCPMNSYSMPNEHYSMPNEQLQYAQWTVTVCPMNSYSMPNEQLQYAQWTLQYGWKLAREVFLFLQNSATISIYYLLLPLYLSQHFSVVPLLLFHHRFTHS